MTWTHDAPTKPGWYWWRVSNNTTITQMCEVCWNPVSKRLVFFETGNKDIKPITDITKLFPSCQWSSTPIPEPKEPQ